MNKTSIEKTRLGLIACASAVACLGASAALAGEITGNGKSLKNPDGTLNGQSECAFSGREDDPADPMFKGDKAQSWGLISQAIRDFLTTIGLHPGDACNPAKSGG